MSSFLGFLKGATVTEVSSTKKGSGSRKQFNPAPALLALRVWKDGSVYPSAALVDKFHLEYTQVSYTDATVPAKKEGEAAKTVKKLVYPADMGNGFDVINSKNWVQYKAAGDMLFIAPVPKDKPKVDLFGSTTYDQATGKPKASVMDQGAQTYGKDVLLPALKDVYDIELSDEKEYVDLLVVEELEGVNIPAVFSKPLTFAPKRITRGTDIGKEDYERRENLTIYGLVPAELIAEPTNGKVEGQEGLSEAPDKEAVKAINKTIAKHPEAVVN